MPSTILRAKYTALNKAEKSVALKDYILMGRNIKINE